MKKHILLIIAAAAGLLTACNTPKEMLYFHKLASEGDIIQSIPDSIKNYESPIAPDDMLAITVTSIDPNAVAMFNLPTQNFMVPGEEMIMTTPSLQTYLVDNDGYIDYPVLGRIKVAGMQRNELAQYLKNEISRYVEDPIVNIQCTNFKISVLGEVTKPGTYDVSGERITILEAIGLANDITIYGNHSNVLLVREENGTRSFHRLDLTKPDVFTSPYYYLQRNDVVVVEPNKARQGYANYSQDKQYLVSVVSAVTSAVSVIVSLCIALFVK